MWLSEPYHPTGVALQTPGLWRPPSQGSGGSPGPEGTSASLASPHLALGFKGIPASFIFSRHGNILSSWKRAERVCEWGLSGLLLQTHEPRQPPETPWRPGLTLALPTWSVGDSRRATGGAAGSWLCSQPPGLIGSGAGAGLAGRGRQPAGRRRALGSHVPACLAQHGPQAQHLSPPLSSGWPLPSAATPTRLSDYGPSWDP